MRYYSFVASIWLAARLLVPAASYELLTTGTTVQLNQVPYYIPPISVGTAACGNETKSRSGFTPMTVVATNQTTFDLSHLAAVKQNFLATDDVFQDGFLHSICIQPVGPAPLTLNAAGFGSLGVRAHHVTRQDGDALPDGPYFVSPDGAIHRAYRLYPDLQGAFSETAIASADGSFSVLPANVPGQSLAVAVPSRLYFSRSAGKPLAGLRIGVKDIFDVQGLKTSNGNRAWYHFFPAANRTAPSVQRLIGAGAVVVGKMKTSAFANGETATADWVDYHAPWNPRGDGLQDPSSSSAGPAAGEASYPWLDITLGSDTGGSIRSPSQLQGVFGNRPSHGLASLDGAMPLSPDFDTVGLMARSPDLWAAAAKALYGANMTTNYTYPSSLLTVGLEDGMTPDMDRQIRGFLAKLSRFLSARTEAFNLTQSWTGAHPEGPSLTSLVNNTYEILSAKQQTRLVRDPFYASYAAANDDRRPFVNPAPLQRWALGDESPSTIEEAQANKTQFADWFNGNVLSADERSCSSHILVYVPRAPTPKYRNKYLSGPSLPSAFSTSRVSVMSGTPDFVVPIGEVPFTSAVTGHTEYLPLTVDLMAARGCDGMLFSLVKELWEAGIISESQTGRSLVNGGSAHM
ncbi:Asp-tRNAAsn/Glu-tRNAGln amidotransferase A subunit or related amidase [Geosmithia morbida]|uniref:Asp-tRNAAsn/Glu-tRNAGln amidotransferase A subunit or related amidase n=1 Tax=Geosmithia morbida TaxID=1094350 RepID=A0A9P4YQL0_9HYPO|nr:Asp-tRNAAsn/Glu-tRNAGln amidotransferase A subunit or related amidase [Geosmithia morbida]KAF4121311.1 Asp-tRNAAsn/Glu-tRNAGln amidotransferase A subunit or related amidase [Geosmithia morbida]